jgi:hypothetical protein
MILTYVYFISFGSQSRVLRSYVHKETPGDLLTMGILNSRTELEITA